MLKTTKMVFQGIDVSRVSEIGLFFRGPMVRSKVFRTCAVETGKTDKDGKMIKKSSESWGGSEGVAFAKISGNTLNTEHDTHTITVEIVERMEICDWELTQLGAEEDGIRLGKSTSKKITIGCPKEIRSAIFELFYQGHPDDKWTILKLES